MTPDQIILIGQLLLRYGPELAAEFQKLFTTANPTQEQWDKIWTLAGKSYTSYVASK